MAQLEMAVSSRSEGAPGKFCPFARRHHSTGARVEPFATIVPSHCPRTTPCRLPGLGVKLVDVDELLPAPALYLRVLYVLSTGVLWRQGAHSLEI
jgi:hypothetical protein